MATNNNVRISMNDPLTWRDTAVSLLPDLVTLLAVFLLLPALAERMAQPGALNVVIIVGAYVLFFAALMAIKRLEPTSDATLPYWLLHRRTQMALGVLFGLGLSLTLAHQLGYLELLLAVDDRVLGSGESAAFFVMAPGAWLGLALLYVLALSSAPKTAVSHHTTRHAFYSLGALLAVNAMVLLGAAELKAIVAADATGLSPGWAIGGLAVQLLLFGPPRLWYWWKNPQALHIVSFALLLLATSWQISFVGSL